MAKTEHVNLIGQGVPTWNKAMKSAKFKAALDGADLRGARLGRINLSGANLTGVNLGEASLRGANLTDATLVGAVLERADLKRVKFGSANVGGATLSQADFTSISSSAGIPFAVNASAYVDLSCLKNLVQRQIDQARGDNGVILPDHLVIPQHWAKVSLPSDHPIAKDQPNTESQTSDTNTEVPELPAKLHGGGVEFVGSAKLVLKHDDIPPIDHVLGVLYVDLREMMFDLQGLGDLDNVSPLLSRSLNRYIARTPDDYLDLEQQRFGASTEALRFQLAAEEDRLGVADNR